MEIVKRYSNCYILKDIVVDVDHNECFNDFNMNFNFPNDHDHWELKQYTWNDQFDDSNIHNFIFDNIDEIPNDSIIRKGFHEPRVCPLFSGLPSFQSNFTNELSRKPQVSS